MSSWKDLDYAIVRRFDGADFETLLERTRAALPSEGFGVLTEINVRATLKKKLDIDTPNYVILGACQPSLAHQALTAEPGIGVLLPCNVVVAQDGDDIVVAAIEPQKMFSVVNRPDVSPLADEVSARLTRVLDSIKA